MIDDGTEQAAPSADIMASAAMTRMAAKIELNYGQGFAGAFVITPPTGAPIELLLLNSNQSEAIFWGLLKTTAEMALADIADQERKTGGWNR